MKKTILILPLIFAISLQTKAQLGIGASIGIGASEISGKVFEGRGMYNNNIASKPFLPLQLLVQYKLKPKFFLQTGLQYLSLGFQYEMSNSLYDRLDFNYISLPLKVRYNISNKRNNFFFTGGFLLSQAVSGKMRNRHADGTYEIIKLGIGNNPDTDTFKNNDIVLALGFGFEFNSKFLLNFDLYNRSLRNIQSQGDKNNSMYNLFTNASFGYLFKVK